MDRTAFDFGDGVAKSFALPLDRLEPGPQREMGARLEALARAALRADRPLYGPFMGEEEYRVARLLFEGQSDVMLRFFGGWRRAARRRPAVSPRWSPEEPTVTAAVAALWLRPEAKEVKEAKEATEDKEKEDKGGKEGDLPHGAAGGSSAQALALLRALGLEEEGVGDVVSTREGGWHAVVARERADGLGLPRQVRFQGRSWHVEEIPLERLDVPPESVKDVHTTVASLRLDAVASSGFGISRSKAAQEIKAGRVWINWQVVDSPARQVKAGDVIAMAGRGKVVVQSVGGPTRKGRIPVSLQALR